MNADQTEPERLTVSFTISQGDVWIDPEGVAWYVTHTGIERDETHVWFQRKAVTSEEAKTVCRTWRQPNDGKADEGRDST